MQTTLETGRTESEFHVSCRPVHRWFSTPATCECSATSVKRSDRNQQGLRDEIHDHQHRDGRRPPTLQLRRIIQLDASGRKFHRDTNFHRLK